MRPMFINLHSHVLAKLAAREVPWTQVARDTGIPYETLKKIASGRTPNPGVQHVQKLADYFGTELIAAPDAPQAIEAVADAPVSIKHVEAVAAIRDEASQATAEIKHVAEAQAAVKTEVKDVDPPVKLPPLASTEVADKLALDERRKGPPTRRLKKQPFIGPDKRVGPPDRRGFKLPEVTAVLPKGV